MSGRVESGPVGAGAAGRVFIYGLLAFFALLFLMPLFVMLVTSFKTLDGIHDGNMLALPQHPTIAPWLDAWGRACIGLSCNGIKGYFGNSIAMVVPAVAVSTLLGALNGYVLTKWRFPGHRLVFGLMLRYVVHYRADSGVEPTRSQNITVTCRRSPLASAGSGTVGAAIGGAGSGGAGAHEGGRAAPGLGGGVGELDGYGSREVGDYGPVVGDEHRRIRARERS